MAVRTANAGSGARRQYWLRAIGKARLAAESTVYREASRTICSFHLISVMIHCGESRGTQNRAVCSHRNLEGRIPLSFSAWQDRGRGAEETEELTGGETMVLGVESEIVRLAAVLGGGSEF